MKLKYSISDLPRHFHSVKGISPPCYSLHIWTEHVSLAAIISRTRDHLSSILPLLSPPPLTPKEMICISLRQGSAPNCSEEMHRPFLHHLPENYSVAIESVIRRDLSFPWPLREEASLAPMFEMEDGQQRK